MSDTLAIPQQQSPATDIGSVAPPTGPLQHTRPLPSFDYAALMRSVAASTGKSYGRQVREMYQLKFGPGRISPVEYFYYRLYDDAFTPAQKKAFVGHNLRAAVNRKILDQQFFGIGTDKLIFNACMAGAGLAVPKVHALFHPFRRLGGAAELRSGEALASYLRAEENYPFFSKPVDLTASVGSASATGYDPQRDTVQLANGSEFPVDRFAQEAARYFTRGYVLQERLAPHPALNKLAGPALSTVRMMVLADGHAPVLIRATWRVPSGGQHADVLWRGNLMAALDTESGAVVRAIKGSGPKLVELEDHPDSGARLPGFRLPLWREARDLVLQAAAAVPGLPLTGWDLAITDRGPVLIELEPDGGDPTVTQLASGQGLLDGPYGAFLRRRWKR